MVAVTLTLSYVASRFGYKSQQTKEEQLDLKGESIDGDIARMENELGDQVVIYDQAAKRMRTKQAAISDQIQDFTQAVSDLKDLTDQFDKEPDPTSGLGSNYLEKSGEKKAELKAKSAKKGTNRSPSPPQETSKTQASQKATTRRKSQTPKKPRTPNPRIPKQERRGKDNSNPEMER
ncbi:hypothetical protein ABZ635_05925 [Nocardiopsis sp. NPDC007018]|uniref:hypothetical protein n=1 Tax=Nocardiopsis sp. NPDC007018 TaxID=3155721 RepID=UPI0033CB1CAB